MRKKAAEPDAAKHPALEDAVPFPCILGPMASMVSEELEPGTLTIARVLHENGEISVRAPSSRKSYQIPAKAVARVTPESIETVHYIPVTNNGDDGPRLLPVERPHGRMADLVLPGRVSLAVADTIERIQGDARLREVAALYGALPDNRVNLTILKGASGSGKTSVVHAIAREVGARIVRVGTTTIGSSYQSVSQLAIRDVMSVAHRARHKLVVLFDDGDDQMGARGESSSTRLMDAEVASLLQAVETNPGAVVFFTTNLNDGLDPAVLTRSFTIQFDPPDALQRAALVSKLILSDRISPAADLRSVVRAPISMREVASICAQVVRLAARRHLETNELQVLDTAMFEEAANLVLGDRSARRAVGFRS